MTNIVDNCRYSKQDRAHHRAREKDQNDAPEAGQRDRADYYPDQLSGGHHVHRRCSLLVPVTSNHAHLTQG